MGPLNMMQGQIDLKREIGKIGIHVDFWKKHLQYDVQLYVHMINVT